MKLKTFLFAATLAGAAGLSFADPPQPVPLLPAGPGLLAGEFTRSVNGLFVDTFSFLPESFSGRVSVSLSSLHGPVSFFTASLNGQNFSYFPELGEPAFAFSARVSSSTPLSLAVFGAVLDAAGQPWGSGAYAGTISAAVPEPQTWAMLLAGLVSVGAAVARRARGAG